MLRHIEMDDAAAIVGKHHKYEKHSKRCRWHREEVDRDQVEYMIVQKAPQLGEGGFGWRIIYLDTAAWDT